MTIRIFRARYKDKILGTIFTVKKWGEDYVTLTGSSGSFKVTHDKLKSDFEEVK